MNKKLTLQAWLKPFNSGAMAKKLNVHYSTIDIWKNSESLPRTEYFLRLVKMSGGTVDIEASMRYFVRHKPFRTKRVYL